MTDYEISLKQLKKAGIKPKVGKKALFLSFSECGLMRVKIKKVKKETVLLTPCKDV